MPIDRKAAINSNESRGDYRLMRIASPELGRAARPGQFVMVKVADGCQPLLRRPLGVHDADGSGIELLFKIAGAGTAVLAAKRPGDAVDLLGPLGKGFSVEAGLEGGPAYLVGGGRGIAPLYFLAKELVSRGAKVTVFYGGRSAADLVVRERFALPGVKLLCSTDDGSYGAPGLVTELVAARAGSDRPGMLYACGPDAMLQALQKLVSGLGLRAEFSLESRMGCGIGACWGCVHRIRDEHGESWTKVCEEGPVFPAERVVWTGEAA
jgi:dihydroorotate dehydrogenase electron transfer subunit